VFVAGLAFFLAVTIGLHLLVAPLTMLFHGASWQMGAALAGAIVFFALPFQAFRTGRFRPPLTALGFLCLGVAVQGWLYVTGISARDSAPRLFGRTVGTELACRALPAAPCPDETAQDN